MRKYDHKKIEKKWQKEWDKQGIYKTEDSFPRKSAFSLRKSTTSKKYYILDMFPYPSGEGLHVGHPRGYIGTDIYSRFKTMKGFSVLHPMGFDSFGLPAEQYAIKHKIHPSAAVEKNIKRYKEQLSILGLNYDWGRQVITSDPNYYKWTQWIFLKLYEKGLAYESYESINWCPTCQTGLANEDLEDGKCERCETVVEKKPMRQWVLRITDYADRLLKDLDGLNWPESIKESQRNWIGRSEGAEIEFKLVARSPSFTKTTAGRQELGAINVFTTRPDTLFGVTYLVLSPEHEQIPNLKSQITNWNEVEKYIEEAKKKTEIERTAEGRGKSGVELKGIKAINPAFGGAGPVNKEVHPAESGEIPVWVADYVLPHYGTGAIMAVPAHDERDFEFAKKFNLSIIEVISGGDVKREAYEGEGALVNSRKFNGMDSEKAKDEITKFVKGEKKVNYKLRDWVFSRQRYWGEPIPIIHCEKCGVVPVPEKDLPVVLPEVEHYEPTGTGESPLANIEEWVNTTCPKCGGPGKRETNTMPQWAGSSWYYLRYIDPKNDTVLVDKGKEKYWSPVDLYVGGTEHATRHLIYARFWHKFLYDIGVVNYKEPFTQLKNQGMILGDDGRKMSKRWGNVVNPDDIVETYGADTLRLYEMFMGPFTQMVNWSTESIIGPRRFLEKVWRLGHKVPPRTNAEQTRKDAEKGLRKSAYSLPAEASAQAGPRKSASDLESLLHKSIKKVTLDIENFHFNTAISQMMILINELENEAEISQKDIETFLKLLAPFAPHITEELWQQFFGNSKFQISNLKQIPNSKSQTPKQMFRSIHLESWPQYDESKIVDEVINLVVQINGKVRTSIEISVGMSEDEIKELVFENDVVKKWVGEKEIMKVIYIRDKLINIVVK